MKLTRLPVEVDRVDVRTAQVQLYGARAALAWRPRRLGPAQGHQGGYVQLQRPESYVWANSQVVQICC